MKSISRKFGEIDFTKKSKTWHNWYLVLPDEHNSAIHFASDTMYTLQKVAAIWRFLPFSEQFGIHPLYFLVG